MSPLLASARLRWQTFWHKAVQTGRLICGVPDYDNYVAHMRQAHPDAPMMDYPTFFRDRMNARYGRGRSRCC